MNREAVPVRGERSTEPLDLADADESFRDLLATTRDPVAAAVLVAGLLIAEALREGRPS